MAFSLTDGDRVPRILVLVSRFGKRYRTDIGQTAKTTHHYTLVQYDGLHG